ncbi:MAG: O-antigen ligase family protein [Solirubrobacteraceae bacterium]
MALVPALAAVGVMILWAVHDGGYDDDTWYWGALAMLALLTVSVIALGPRRRRLTRPAAVGLGAFGAYVAWSYLSITWAQVPGEALEGSNRALLYLLVFALFLVLPWSAGTALLALVVYAFGVGVIAVVLMARLASGDQISQLVIAGRLAAPTGYFNSTVALFMIGALLCTALASRSELPGVLRGLLIACGSASLQLCVVGQSRGWLFTLPLVFAVVAALMRDRLRIAVMAVLPVAAAVVPIHRLLDIFEGGSVSNAAVTLAARSAAHESLLICGAVFVLGTLLAWSDRRIRAPSLSGVARRRLGVAVAVVAVAGAGAGAVVATHGRPLAFLERQWNGFSHQSTGAEASSHFADVGSGRYDFWRVALDAFVADPVQGLGQDNFADYYVSRRRTGEDPRWPHSLEMRLLAMTGIVGFALFAAFLAGALVAAVRARRRGPSPLQAVAGIALIPVVVWLIHGSVDWFWEMPALSGPALGFMGMSAALASRDLASPDLASPRPVAGWRRGPRLRGPAVPTLGALAVIAAAVALILPYLSVREVSIASNVQVADPAAALHDLAIAADLNPLSPDPGHMAGTIALQTGRFREAESRFRQMVSVEPETWYGWLGDGLAASALRERARALRDFRTAATIDAREPVVQSVLARASGPHPLSTAEALAMLSADDFKP